MWTSYIYYKLFGSFIPIWTITLASRETPVTVVHAVEIFFSVFAVRSKVLYFYVKMMAVDCLGLVMEFHSCLVFGVSKSARVCVHTIKPNKAFKKIRKNICSHTWLYFGQLQFNVIHSFSYSSSHPKALCIFARLSNESTLVVSSATYHILFKKLFTTKYKDSTYYWATKTKTPDRKQKTYTQRTPHIKNEHE